MSKPRSSTPPRSLHRTEGIIPAPRAPTPSAAAIDEAIKAKVEGKKKVILFNLSGHGLMDMTSYDAYLAGNAAMRAEGRKQKRMKDEARVE